MNVSADDKELWRILGSIQSSLETVKGTLSDDRIASAQYRTDVRKEFSDIKDSIGEIKTDQKQCKEDIGEMKPKVDSQERRMLMSKGAANLAVAFGKIANVIWGGLGATLALLADRWFFHGAPPGGH